jgi:hypothetical protein
VARRIATIAVCIGLSSPALAVEWSMDTSLRETVEVSDNPFVANTPVGGVGSHSTWNGHVTGQTKTSRFDFDADFSYNKYWGPAAKGAGSLAETTDNGVKLHYETFGKVPGDRAYIDGIWRRQDASGAIFNDFGVPTGVKGDIHTTTVVGGIDRSLTATDRWTLTTRATSTDYDPRPIGTQYYDFAATSNFRHQSNRTSAVTGLTEFEWLKYDNSTETNVAVIRYMAGVDLKPFKNVSFVATAGAATVITEQGSLVPVVNPLVPLPSSGVASSFIGDATLTYDFSPTAQLILNAGQSIGPTVIGVLALRQYANAGIRYTINSLETLGARVDVTRQIISTSQTDFFSASATYSRTLARDLNLDLTYRYSHRHATVGGSSNVTVDPITGLPILLNGTDTSSGSSNTIVMTLSKRFVLLPKRT